MISQAVLLLSLLAVSSHGHADPEVVVRKLYRYIVAHRPLGIPAGKDRRALWPLMTKRLVAILETGAACEEDYYRQHRNDDGKPEFAWLETGLFSGSNERAMPVQVTVVGRKSIAPQQFKLVLRFKYRDTFDTYGRPPDDSNTFTWRGTVLVDCSADSCAVDDFIPSEGLPLSKSFVGCKGQQWVGETAPTHR
jgi:hypothetical protein